MSFSSGFYGLFPTNFRIANILFGNLRMTFMVSAWMFRDLFKSCIKWIMQTEDDIGHNLFKHIHL